MSGITTIGFGQSVKAEDIILSEVKASEGALHQIADTMNKILPMMVDRDTRWDAIYAGPGKSLSYSYTVVNYSAADLGGSLFAKNARPILTQRVCNEPNVVIFPQEGVSLNFNYYDNTRNLIARVKVQPSDCGY